MDVPHTEEVELMVPVTDEQLLGDKEPLADGEELSEKVAVGQALVDTVELCDSDTVSDTVLHRVGLPEVDAVVVVEGDSAPVMLTVPLLHVLTLAELLGEMVGEPLRESVPVTDTEAVDVPHTEDVELMVPVTDE